jgi:putrescine transport system ATP-binding protein
VSDPERHITAPSAQAAGAHLQLRELSKRYGEVLAVDTVSLAITRGEIFCLLGASGSGKTTLLRLLAGFETPDAGRVLLDEEDITHVPPYRRPLNMMFQSYALFPHLSVERNVAFGLEQERLSRDQITRRVGQILDVVRLGALARRKPHQLSGGQRQRVALARALVKRPKLLLLDEPLAALDRKLREHTQFELLNIQQELGVTFVVVTHDQEEAMTLATRIGVMDHGRIVQVGTPREIYQQPATRFVAGFIGSVNLLEGRVLGRQTDRGQQLHCEELPVPLLVPWPAGAAAGAAAPADLAGGTGAVLWVALRPEQLRLSRAKPAQPCNWAQGVIREVAYRGDLSVYLVRLPGGRELRATLTNSSSGNAAADFTRDAPVYVSWEADSAVVGSH